MTRIVLHSTSGPDGKLHLEVPVGTPNTEFEVEVVVRPKSAGSHQEYLDFLRRTAGAWQGDFERPDSGPPRSEILSDDRSPRCECLGGDTQEIVLARRRQIPRHRPVG